MKKCIKCGKDITPDLVVAIYGGYKRNSCKICIRKQSRDFNRKRSKLLKNLW